MNIDYIILRTENTTHCLKETNCQWSIFGGRGKKGENFVTTLGCKIEWNIFYTCSRISSAQSVRYKCSTLISSCPQSVKPELIREPLGGHSLRWLGTATSTENGDLDLRMWIWGPGVGHGETAREKRERDSWRHRCSGGHHSHARLQCLQASPQSSSLSHPLLAVSAIPSRSLCFKEPTFAFSCILSTTIRF